LGCGSTLARFLSFEPSGSAKSIFASVIRSGLTIWIDIVTWHGRCETDFSTSAVDQPGENNYLYRASNSAFVAATNRNHTDASRVPETDCFRTSYLVGRSA
jgi:hypothetical protein